MLLVCIIIVVISGIKNKYPVSCGYEPLSIEGIYYLCLSTDWKKEEIETFSEEWKRRT